MVNNTMRVVSDTVAVNSYRFIVNHITASKNISASGEIIAASANVNYSEISPDGMIIVNSSTTSSHHIM